MTHDYEGCEKNLEDCRWCLGRAKKLCLEHGFDVQELDHAVTFGEQTILQHIRESEDDGVHNEAARELLGLGKKGSKKKPKIMKIEEVLEGLEYLGAET